MDELSKKPNVEGMTRARWKKFVTHELLEKLGQERLIFWDNLGIHYDSSMRDKLREAGHAVFSTPAYSPEGNPIEYMFFKLKTYVRKQCPRSASTLREAVAAGLQTITLQNIASYFFVAWGHVLSWS